MGAALVGAVIHVVRDAQTFDLASGEILGVRTVRPAPPEDFFLSQSYPNPFNPATRLQFRIARHQPVRLIVYDLTGKEIATLLDGPVDPGTYTVTFDGSGLATPAEYSLPGHADAQRVADLATWIVARGDLRG